MGYRLAPMPSQVWGAASPHALPPPPHRFHNEWYWQCVPGFPSPVPMNTVIVTLYFQLEPGTVTCADIDPAAAAAFVLQRAQTLAGSTGRTFSAGPPATCTDKPVPAGAGRRLLETQAVLVTKVTSVGPKPAGDATSAADDLARLVQSTVQATLVEVLETAVTSPGFDAAAAAATTKTRLGQIELDGQPLLSSPPPPPVVELSERPCMLLACCMLDWSHVALRAL
jgi:hypothetical protein